MSVCLLVTFVSPAKTAEPIEMSFGGAESRGLKEAFYSMMSRSDESIRRREGWQEGDVAFCQNCLTTFSLIIIIIIIIIIILKNPFTFRLSIEFAIMQ